MRLLHTRKLRFQDFFDDQVPPYAILSHTWEADEVSYQDFLAIRREEKVRARARKVPATYVSDRMRKIYRINVMKILARLTLRNSSSWAQQRKRAGYQKILACCQHAATDTTEYYIDEEICVRGPYEWVWIDTCCIDKSSSAELSEAINSMHDWYFKSEICYAYLSDVAKSDNSDKILEDFRTSRWFTRGWTLQELLAPRAFLFLDKNWRPVGTKLDLIQAIGDTTDICMDHIDGSWRACAAETMCWAVTRRTRRKEDEAYCLLGLLRINMPLLYGEGAEALRRLQMEIIKTTHDESIFVWDYPSQPLTIFVELLADEFGGFDLWTASNGACNNWMPLIPRPPYSTTNQGLELRVPKNIAAKEEFLLPLSVPHFESGLVVGAYAIMLSQIHGGWKRVIPSPNDVFVRELGDNVRRLHARSSIFIVALNWIWSRDELERRGSAIIYALL